MRTVVLSRANPLIRRPRSSDPKLIRLVRRIVRVRFYGGKKGEGKKEEDGGGRNAFFAELFFFLWGGREREVGKGG